MFGNSSTRYIPTACACTLVCATLCSGQMHAQACACIPLGAVCVYTRLYVRTHVVVVVKKVATQTTRRRSLPAAPFEDRTVSQCNDKIRPRYRSRLRIPKHRRTRARWDIEYGGKRDLAYTIEEDLSLSAWPLLSTSETKQWPDS